MKKSLLYTVLFTGLLVGSINAQTLAPDGSFVGGDPELAADGSYTGE